ncbi:MAG: outer membrane beta-barrel protein [Candidatus Hodarchaeota archaeon]
MRHSKSKLRTIFTTLILLLYLTSSSLAQSRSRSFSLSLTGGFLSNTTFGKLNPLPNTADVPEITVILENLGASFGLSLGYMFTERFELQGTFTYNRSEIINDVGIGLAGIPLGKTKVSSAKGLYYSGNILYHFLINRISPFFTAGLGAVTLKTDKLRSRTKLFLNFGAGVKFILNRKLAVFVEFKDHVSFFNYPKDFDVIFVAIYAPDFKKTQHRLGISIGLSYLF